DAGACDVASQRIVGGDERQIDLDTLWHSRSGPALGGPVAGGLFGALVADRRLMILAMGLVDVGQELGPFVGQRPTASEQVARGPHGGRRDRGRREDAPHTNSCNLV